MRAFQSAHSISSRGGCKVAALSKARIQKRGFLPISIKIHYLKPDPKRTRKADSRLQTAGMTTVDYLKPDTHLKKYLISLTLSTIFNPHEHTIEPLTETKLLLNRQLTTGSSSSPASSSRVRF
jgi:hypothetical protein